MMSGSLAGGSQPSWDKVKPEEILKDPRVAEPILEIAMVTGLSTEEIEQAVLAMMTPSKKPKRRH